MSKRDADGGSLEWGGLMECKKELSCECRNMAQAVGWRPGRPYRTHGPKLGEGKRKAIKTGRRGRRLLRRLQV